MCFQPFPSSCCFWFYSKKPCAAEETSRPAKPCFPAHGPGKFPQAPPSPFPHQSDNQIPGSPRPPASCLPPACLSCCGMCLSLLCFSFKHRGTWVSCWVGGVTKPWPRAIGVNLGKSLAYHPVLATASRTSILKSVAVCLTSQYQHVCLNSVHPENGHLQLGSELDPCAWGDVCSFCIPKRYMEMGHGVSQTFTTGRK